MLAARRLASTAGPRPTGLLYSLAVAETEVVGEPSGEPAHRRRLARSTAIFALATGVSRILGLLREIVARRYFGVEGSINAFTVAFQVPNLVRALVADTALSSAFVPVFSELLEKGEKRRAWHVASSVFFLLLLGALRAHRALHPARTLDHAAVRLRGRAGGPRRRPLASPLPGRGAPRRLRRDRRDPQQLRAVHDPGDHADLLEPRDHHRAGRRRAPGGHASRRSSTSTRAACSSARSSRCCCPCRGCFASTVASASSLDWRDPAVRRVFALMLPVALGLGLINFNLVVDTFFAARLLDPELAPSAIDAAFRIYMLPQGIVLGRDRDRALPVALAARRARRLRRLPPRRCRSGCARSASRSLPASAVGAVLCVPIVRLLYQRGAFTPDQTTVVARGARRVHDRTHVQRDDADAEPRASSASSPRGFRRGSRSATSS